MRLEDRSKERKDPIKQLEVSKSGIKNLFSDLLSEGKGSK